MTDSVPAFRLPDGKVKSKLTILDSAAPHLFNDFLIDIAPWVGWMFKMNTQAIAPSLAIVLMASDRASSGTRHMTKCPGWTDEFMIEALTPWIWNGWARKRHSAIVRTQDARSGSTCSVTLAAAM